MPILLMALMSLAVFLVMGGMLFYAAYAESKETKKKVGKANGGATAKGAHA